jgi:hypothetical protein
MAALLPTRSARTVLAILLCIFASANAFAPSRFTLPSRTLHHNSRHSPIFNSNENNGIIDLTDEDDEPAVTIPSSTSEAPNQVVAAPFLSQGELSTDPNLLNPDFKDPKQTRVIIYIILTLVPILFLIPLMIGSRDLIPLDALPPVELN